MALVGKPYVVGQTNMVSRERAVLWAKPSSWVGTSVAEKRGPPLTCSARSLVLSLLLQKYSLLSVFDIMENSLLVLRSHRHIIFYYFPRTPLER